jgi:hypothetical protein
VSNLVDKNREISRFPEGRTASERTVSSLVDKNREISRFPEGRTASEGTVTDQAPALARRRRTSSGRGTGPTKRAFGVRPARG